MNGYTPALFAARLSDCRFESPLRLGTEQAIYAHAWIAALCTAAARRIRPPPLLVICRMKRLVLYAGLWLGLATSPVAAQVEAVDELDPIVVTATRTAQTADETLASVTVIDRAEMDRRQSRTMTDVLRGLPGVEISSNGGLGHNTSVYLRGTRPDHTLLLIDGVRSSFSPLRLP